ncbi:hypothetical protein RWE15_19170 [Virgibacillus halophilus]|uniref:Small, acid-soluble spore protein, alpha/beta type n=1 Tax=Tigheibacillus halophilus TaxID=361280 RepID=A0ABU5C9T5_9BACI|nr:hypothetical protein [Virgibacillus halophilus]
MAGENSKKSLPLQKRMENLERQLQKHEEMFDRHEKNINELEKNMGGMAYGFFEGNRRRCGFHAGLGKKIRRIVSFSR